MHNPSTEQVKKFTSAKFLKEPCGGCAMRTRGADDAGNFSYLSHGEGDPGSGMIQINMTCAKCGGSKSLQVDREAFV